MGMSDIAEYFNNTSRIAEDLKDIKARLVALEEVCRQLGTISERLQTISLLLEAHANAGKEKAK